MRSAFPFSFLLSIIFTIQLYPQWQMMNSPASSINDILVLPSGRIIAGTSDGLFFSNDNGATWDSTSLHSNVKIIKKDNSGNIYGIAGFMYYSLDNGLTWNQCVTSYPDQIKNFFINDSNYIFVLENPYGGLQVFKSTDMCASWNSLLLIAVSSIITFGIVVNSFETIFISYIETMYGIGAQVEKKEIGGSWVPLIGGIIVNNMYFFDGTMFLATSGEGIYKSNDNGASLIQINNGLTSNSVKQIILTPEVFICLADNGVFRSLDGGDHWAYLDHTGLPSTEINRIYYSDTGTLYACTNNGIYIFTGELPVELTSFTAETKVGKVVLNWSTATEINNHGFEIQRKIENKGWITIGFREGKGTTTEESKYFYTDDVSGLSASEIFYRLKQVDFNGTFSYSDRIRVTLNPVEYELYQNYPNPFNPTTKIKYSVVDETNINLTVFDVLGNEVKILVNEKKKPGHYELEFKGDGLTSGIYFYKLQTDDFVSIKKMILIK